MNPDQLEQVLDQESLSSVRARVPRALLVPATFSGLLGEALTEWVLILGLYALWFAIPALALPCFLLVAGRYHALGVILHDACHLKKNYLLLDLLCGWPIMMTTASMRYHHLRHHRDTNQPTDPYFKPRAATSKLWWSWAFFRHILLLPFFALRPYFGLAALAHPRLRLAYARAFLQDKSADPLESTDEINSCARQEFGLLLFQGALLIVATLAPTPFYWGYVLPGLLTGLLAGWRVMAEHTYLPIPDRKLSSVLSVTRDHGLGVLGALWLAPRNVGYHIVHHFHPQVAGQYLPTLAKWYRENLPSPSAADP